jgi:hypothetical protein
MMTSVYVIHIQVLFITINVYFLMLLRNFVFLCIFSVFSIVPKACPVFRICSVYPELYLCGCHGCILCFLCRMYSLSGLHIYVGNCVILIDVHYCWWMDRYLVLHCVVGMEWIMYIWILEQFCNGLCFWPVWLGIPHPVTFAHINTCRSSRKVPVTVVWS